jgi:hypothetical protein
MKPITTHCQKPQTSVHPLQATSLQPATEQNVMEQKDTPEPLLSAPHRPMLPPTPAVQGQQPVPRPTPVQRPSMMQRLMTVSTRPMAMPQQVPPHANTEDAWQTHKQVPLKRQDQLPMPHEDVQMQDGTTPPTKLAGSYHFTSTVQDMVNSDVIQEIFLNMVITQPFKEVIGISVDLQK